MSPIKKKNCGTKKYIYIHCQGLFKTQTKRYKKKEMKKKKNEKKLKRLKIN